jgi:hypothetical protein
VLNFRISGQSSEGVKVARRAPAGFSLDAGLSPPRLYRLGHPDAPRPLLSPGLSSSHDVALRYQAKKGLRPEPPSGGGRLR